MKEFTKVEEMKALVSDNGHQYRFKDGIVYRTENDYELLSPMQGHEYVVGKGWSTISCPFRTLEDAYFDYVLTYDEAVNFLKARYGYNAIDKFDDQSHYDENWEYSHYYHMTIDPQSPPPLPPGQQT
jgi:hypothetical protein